MEIGVLIASFLDRAGDVAGEFFAATWWFISFLILLPLAKSAWLTYKHRAYEHHEMKSVLLELRMPREILKNARGMDQFLQSVHALGNFPGDFGEKYMDGEVTRWYSLEMVSFSGEVHFYLRCYYKQRGLIEAALYSYYPDIEIVEVEDYIHRLPKTYADIDAQGSDIWAGEMVLKKDPMYPIRTYLAFETPDESAQLDPMSAFLEVLAKVKPGEFVGIQYNFAPVERKYWPTHAMIKNLEKLKEPKRMEIESEFSFPLMVPKSDMERKIIEDIEKNFDKPAFDVVIRFMYISPKTTFYDSFPRRGITGAFNQYGAAGTNYFSPNYPGATRVKSLNKPLFFPKVRERLRKQRFVKYYREREFIMHTFFAKLLTSHPLEWNNKSKPIILNSEALATLFHPPTNLVITAPHTKRVESRKFAAPAGLSIYGDDKEIEQFYSPKDKK